MSKFSLRRKGRREMKDAKAITMKNSRPATLGDTNLYTTDYPGNHRDCVTRHR